MAWTSPLAAAVLTVGLAFGPAVRAGGRDTADAAALGPRRAQMERTGLTPAQASMLDWAVGLFDAAGLRLPDLTVVAHDTVDACWGRTGAHVRSDGHSTVHLCSRETGPPEQLLYVHELAHAWDAEALTADRRAAFLALRGLAEWRNDDPERWYERGAEQAAEMILWGLMDRPVWIVSIRGVTCADLLAGYVTLVGRAPPHGYTEFCDL